MPPARGLKGTRRGQSTDNPRAIHGQSKPSPPLSPSPKEKISNPHPHTHPDNNSTREAVSKPDDVSDQVWSDWRKHRKRIKADVTPTAIAGVRREAVKAGWSMEAALAESVTQGWRGFKADWITKATGPPKAANQSRGSSLADIGNEVRQLYGQH